MKEDIPLADQRLVFGNSDPLKDGLKLSDYNIQNMSTLYLSVRIHKHSEDKVIVERALVLERRALQAEHAWAAEMQRRMQAELEIEAERKRRVEMEMRAATTMKEKEAVINAATTMKEKEAAINAATTMKEKKAATTLKEEPAMGITVEEEPAMEITVEETALTARQRKRRRNNAAKALADDVFLFATSTDVFNNSAY